MLHCGNKKDTLVDNRYYFESVKLSFMRPVSHYLSPIIQCHFISSVTPLIMCMSFYSGNSSCSGLWTRPWRSTVSVIHESFVTMPTRRMKFLPTSMPLPIGRSAKIFGYLQSNDHQINVNDHTVKTSQKKIGHWHSKCVFLNHITLYTCVNRSLNLFDPSMTYCRQFLQYILQGASILRMIRDTMGHDTFKRGITVKFWNISSFFFNK